MFAPMHAESVLQILDLLEQRLLPIIKRLVSLTHQCPSPRPSIGWCCQAGWYGAQGVSVSSVVGAYFAESEGQELKL